MLQEFYVAVTRKIAKPLSPDRAMALMDEYRVFPTVARARRHMALGTLE